MKADDHRAIDEGMAAASGAQPAPMTEHFANDIPARTISRALAVEAPVAIEINGIGYAVMMATPTDLEDFAFGFCLSERLVRSSDDLHSIQATKVESGGWMLRIQVAAPSAAPLIERVRLRVAEGSCGLCGLESLEQVLRPLAPVTARLDVTDAAIFAAVTALPAHQPLGARTRAAHAAAFCDPSGRILIVREDVGRHNALDKLIGACARADLSIAEGFVLLTARCSFELVQKVIVAGCPVLATISAPSTLAVEQAAAHGVRLIGLARDDSFLAP